MYCNFKAQTTAICFKLAGQDVSLTFLAEQLVLLSYGHSRNEANLLASNNSWASESSEKITGADGGSISAVVDIFNLIKILNLIEK